MSQINLDDILYTATDVARQAGEKIRAALEASRLTPCSNTAVGSSASAAHDASSVGHPEYGTKATFADLVTETDTAVERFIFGALRARYPNHIMIGEESSSESGAKPVLTTAPTWCVDPIDGTTNFVHGFYFSCVSIAFLVDRQMTVGVVYNPTLGHMYTAVRGRGAFLNGSPIRVSGTTEISRALVCSAYGSSRVPETIEGISKNLKSIVSKCHGIRMIGSAALHLCSVAEGRSDAYFEMGIHCWDMAAGALIVQEAGGFLLHPDGGEFDLMSRTILATSTQGLAKQLQPLIVDQLTYGRE